MAAMNGYESNFDSANFSVVAAVAGGYAASSCGNDLYELRARTNTTVCKPLILETKLLQQSNILVGQFDGSFISGTRAQAAGAGITLWEISNNGSPKILERFGIELPTAQDSAEAEAAALSLLTQEMLRLSAKNHYDQFLVQGDNQAIIYFFSGNFKLKSLSVFKHLEKAWDIRANYLPNILFEHIPRESNKFYPC
jgi:hypothetical protein